MERSAVYRRALAPVMIFVGAVGLVAAAVGLAASINTERSFILYWAAVAAVALAGSFLLVRRQALRDAEPFWSPPTRRVTQAFLPPLVAGFALSGVVFARMSRMGLEPSGFVQLLPGWVVLYGCAFHAAGFFMPRGMRLFGWIFIVAGCALYAVDVPVPLAKVYLHGTMGFFFGVLHLAYGGYLYLTEKGKNAA